MPINIFRVGKFTNAGLQLYFLMIFVFFSCYYLLDDLNFTISTFIMSSFTYVLLGIFFRFVFNGIAKVMVYMGLLFGRVANPLIFFILYFLVFTPYSFIGKVFGRDVLRIGPSVSMKKSTWSSSEDASFSESSFKKMW